MILLALIAGAVALVLAEGEHRVSDDYSRALALARSRQVPLFVEAWAPWCHTCRSMRAFVLTDPVLASRAERFVWLEIEIEKAQNAAFLEKYPIHAHPAFLMIDPADERVARRWMGSLSLPQLERFLDEASTAIRKPRARRIWGTLMGQGMPHWHSTPDDALEHADGLSAEDAPAEAALDYQVALGSAPADWPQYGRAAASLLGTLRALKTHELAVAVAREALGRLKETPYRAIVAIGGLDSALALGADNAERRKLVSRLEWEVSRHLQKPPPGVAAVDLSSGYALLVEARKRAEDEEGVRRVANEWASYLEQEAARAQTPEQRAVFDEPRLSAYRELGRTERAIPMLEASERDLPDDYNPPARLARAYERLKRWDEALGASDRALAKAYGPRKLQILLVRADIHAGRVDKDAERRTLGEAIAFAEALPAVQRSQIVIQSLRNRLRALE